MEAQITTTTTDSEGNENRLWRIVTDHPDIFDFHIVPKLNGNDVKFFYDVNSESRRAIQKSSNARLPDAFKIGDFHTKSTLSWALEKCSENRERFCWRMARNGNLELLQFLRENGCPWDDWTCWNAAGYGHLECLKYAHENGCPWDWRTCCEAAEEGKLECLQYADEHGCPWGRSWNVFTNSFEDACSSAAKNGHLDCTIRARKRMSLGQKDLF